MPEPPGVTSNERVISDSTVSSFLAVSRPLGSTRESPKSCVMVTVTGPPVGTSFLPQPTTTARTARSTRERFIDRVVYDKRAHDGKSHTHRDPPGRREPGEQDPPADRGLRHGGRTQRPPRGAAGAGRGALPRVARAHPE